MCTASPTAGSWDWAVCGTLMGVGIMRIAGMDMEIMRLTDMEIVRQMDDTG